MYRLDIYQMILQFGFFSVTFPFCSWGTPFQKLSWWLGNNPFLCKLRSSCSCGQKGAHFRVQGTFDSKRLRQFSRLCKPSANAVFDRSPQLGEHVARFSGAYPKPLCAFIAKQNRLRILQSDDLEHRSPVRPFSRPPYWMTELGKSLHWQKLLQYPVKNQNHINVNEHLAYRSLLKHVSKTSPHSRFAVLLDSQVIIGCNAKGRSSSKQLNFYLGSSLPYIIGGDLYPHLLHIGTHDNASDDISRFVDLRRPACPFPPWLSALNSGSPELFDQVREADKLEWPFNGWARLVRLSIVALSKWYSAMPRPRKSCVESRSHISLDTTANRHVETNKRRAACFRDFTGWIKREIDLPLTESCFPPLRMSEALTAYGKHLFYSGSPKCWFAETINAVIDHFPNYKGQIPAAWTTLCRWEEAEPVERAMIMPPSIFKAAISLSLLWGWYKFTGAMLLGFHGLLRPSEFCRWGGLIWFSRKMCFQMNKFAMWRFWDRRQADSCFVSMLGSVMNLLFFTWMLSLATLRTLTLYSTAALRFSELAGTVCSSILGLPLLKKPMVWLQRLLGAVVLLGFSTALRTSTECCGGDGGNQREL